jgi:hypothetical protein
MITSLRASCCVPDCKLQAASASRAGRPESVSPGPGTAGRSAVSLTVSGCRYTSMGEQLQACIAGRWPPKPPLTLVSSESTAHTVLMRISVRGDKVWLSDPRRCRAGRAGAACDGRHGRGGARRRDGLGHGLARRQGARRRAAGVRRGRRRHVPRGRAAPGPHARRIHVRARAPAALPRFLQSMLWHLKADLIATFPM